MPNTLGYNHFWSRVKISIPACFHKFFGKKSILKLKIYPSKISLIHTCIKKIQMRLKTKFCPNVPRKTCLLRHRRLLPPLKRKGRNSTNAISAIRGILHSINVSSYYVAPYHFAYAKIPRKLSHCMEIVG